MRYMRYMETKFILSHASALPHPVFTALSLVSLFLTILGQNFISIPRILPAFPSFT
jgi:hypothetical protein